MYVARQFFFELFDSTCPRPTTWVVFQFTKVCSWPPWGKIIAMDHSHITCTCTSTWGESRHVILSPQSGTERFSLARKTILVAIESTPEPDPRSCPCPAMQQEHRRNRKIRLSFVLAHQEAITRKRKRQEIFFSKVVFPRPQVRPPVRHGSGPNSPGRHRSTEKQGGQMDLLPENSTARGYEIQNRPAVTLSCHFLTFDLSFLSNLLPFLKSYLS